MAKKSEATLAKEAALKQQIEEAKKTVGKVPTISFVPKITAKLKDPHPDVLLRKGKLNVYAAAYLRVVAGFNSAAWKDNYVINPGMHSKFAKQEMVVAGPKVMFPVPYGVYVQLLGKTQLCVKGAPTPLDHCLTQVFADKAMAMTMPDEIGNVLIYIHKQSKWGRTLVKNLTNSDGLIRANLDKVTSWPMLAEYITMSGTSTQKEAVCDIVKSVIRHQAAQAAKKVINDNCNVVGD